MYTSSFLVAIGRNITNISITKSCLVVFEPNKISTTHAKCELRQTQSNTFTRKRIKLKAVLIFEIRRLPRSQISLEIGKKLCNEFHIHINDEERWTLGCLCIFHFLSCSPGLVFSLPLSSKINTALQLSFLRFLVNLFEFIWGSWQFWIFVCLKNN
jgi:hypothetical protein